MKSLKPIVISFLVLVLAASVLPYLLPFTDTAAFTGNYRIPYDLGEDYFLYSRYANHTGSKIPVIGDSVIWGHYTTGQDTLTANLNRLSGREKFANMGLDGIHPAAMNGLVKCFAPNLKNRKVIAGVNLLWMSSPRHDLSGPVNSEINHKILLPQFYPRVPAYAPSIEERISAVIARSVAFFRWLDHVRMNLFAGKSLYLWTMENPHKNIADFFNASGVNYKIPEGMAPNKMQHQHIEWVTPDRSLQWRFMLDTLKLLKKNGNSVAAIIIPFNTHMMTDESREKYYLMIGEIEWVLRENGIVPVLPEAPEKKYFADSSHPNAEGYKIIAEEIMKDREFIDFLYR